jgi:hypothetical protein
MMRQDPSYSPQLRTRLSLQLAGAYLHDACHDLAWLLAHPRLGEGAWRLSVKERTVYWWRARVHLKRITAGRTG